MAPLLEVTRLASITFWSLAFSWTDKPWFLTEENVLLYSSYLPLGVPNGTVIYINTAATSNKFSGTVAREKEDFCKGSFTRTSFTLF
jgi:hypothetical protein